MATIAAIGCLDISIGAVMVTFGQHHLSQLFAHKSACQLQAPPFLVYKSSLELFGCMTAMRRACVDGRNPTLGQGGYARFRHRKPLSGHYIWYQSEVAIHNTGNQYWLSWG